MRVVVAGLYRSGSTALYNIARLILEARGETWAGFEEEYAFRRPEKHHVVKVHRYYPHLAAGSVILTSYRPVEEVRASMERCQELDTLTNGANPDRLGQYVYWLLQWQKDTRYCMHYEMLMRRPERVIRYVAEALEVPTDVEDILEQFEALKDPEEGVDPVTLLHANHRTSEPCESE